MRLSSSSNQTHPPTHTGNLESQPLMRPDAQDEPGDVFQAEWPSIFASRLRLAFIIRRLVLVFSVLSPLLLIWSIKSSTALQVSGAVAASLLFLVFVVEFAVCGVGSLAFSLPLCLLFATIFHATQIPICVLLVILPPLWLVFSRAVHFVSGLLVLPAQLTYSGLGGRFPKLQSQPTEGTVAARQKLRDARSGSPVTITTADGVALDAMFFASPHYRGLQQQQQHSTTMHSPVIVLLNANNEAYEFKDCLVKIYLSANFSVVVFNYRGVSQSGGMCSRDGLILDADATLQFVTKRLRVPLAYVAVVGTSLGGALATEVAAINPPCSLCSDRSFSSLVLEATLVIPDLFHLDTTQLKTKLIVGLLSVLLRFSGWEYKAGTTWKAVKGPKFLMHHPNDSVIPHGARLSTHITKDKALADNTVMIELKQRPADQDGHIAHCRLYTKQEWIRHLDLLAAGLASLQEAE